MEWARAVPEHWEVRRLAAISEMRVSNVDKHSKVGEKPVRLCNYVDVYKNERVHAGIRFMRATATEQEVDRFRLAHGDILITKDSEDWQDIGVPALVEYVADDLLCGYHVAILRPCAGIVSDYLLRALQSNLIAWQFQVAAAGVTRYGLTHNAIRSVRVPLPRLADQRAIARFLDHADRRIRRYIRAKERLIELLEEQKQAIIHQAVTGQIDVRTGQPYPAYKDSGVEWLGRIPTHWERCRLRNVVSEVTTGSRGWSSYAADEGPLFVRVSNLSRGSLELRFDNIVRLDLPATSEASRTRIRERDLLLSVTAYIGSVGVVPPGFEEAYVSQHVARCKPFRWVHARWLGYVLLSPIGQIHGQMCLYGGTKDGLSLDDVRNYPVLIPPRDEQDQMVRWLDHELSSLSSMRVETERQIELLGEYRTRLVADVVTGKLDVRGAAASFREVATPTADGVLDQADTTTPGCLPEPDPALRQAHP